MSIDWVTVREHSRLTTSSITSSLDRAQISQSAFDWLCQLQSSFGGHGAIPVSRGEATTKSHYNKEGAATGETIWNDAVDIDHLLGCL